MAGVLLKQVRQASDPDALREGAVSATSRSAEAKHTSRRHGKRLNTDGAKRRTALERQVDEYIAMLRRQLKRRG